MYIDMAGHLKMLMKSNINIIYFGPIWSETVNDIGNTLKHKSEEYSVFSVFVEQMNNVIHHSEDKYGERQRGMFVFGSADGKYFMQCGNLVKKDVPPKMKARIDHLNSLDKAELRKYYKERMRGQNDNPDSKGAGLGLIEIARRASAPIEYSFTDWDEERVFFTIAVTIESKQEIST